MRTLLRSLLLIAILLTALPAQSEDALARLGWHERSGTAKGYVADTTCGHCHQQLARSFAEVGMGRAFSRPLQGGLPSDFKQATFTHPASGERYRLYRKRDALWFEQRSRDGKHRLVLRVDWAIGSGHRAQSFLHQTEAGELHQLPVTWYAESHRLAASPGYESAQHPGVERRVTHGCMFCHNAYPDLPAGADSALSPDVFPKALPQGIGCQRCHGPGAAHVRSVLEGAPLDSIRASIVQPGKLDWSTRNDVCFQCHLLPAVEVIGPRRIDRDWYSFRPGQALNEYQLAIDAVDAHITKDARFQINHHAWRMQQSPCYVGSAGEMGCTSCHDPHVRRVGSAAEGWYRERCLACHQALPRSHGGGTPEGDDERNCVGCHMARRRTQDVIEVTMTDHRVERHIAPESARLAPLQAREPALTDLQLFRPPPDLDATEAKAYRALAALDHGIDEGALDALTRYVQAMTKPGGHWWLRLARHQAGARRWDAAAASLARLPRDLREQVPAQFIDALIAAGQGDPAAARVRLDALTESAHFLPEAHYNLGMLALRMNDLPAAIRALEHAVQLRPLSAISWLQLSRVQAQAGDKAAARASRARAQAIRAQLESAAAEVTSGPAP